MCGPALVVCGRRQIAGCWGAAGANPSVKAGCLVWAPVAFHGSLAGVVGVMDLTATVSYINNREALGLVTFMVAAVMYLTISLVAGVVGDRLERRLRVLR